MWNKRKRSFRLLGKRYSNTSKIEIREYSPCMRTIKIGPNIWHLPFPYVIFIGRVSINYMNISIAFSKKPVKSMYHIVYHPVLPHVDENWEICMSDEIWNNTYKFSVDFLDVMIADWWNSKFCVFNNNHCSISSSNALKFNFGRIASWKKLNEKQAIEQLCYGPKLFKNFISDFTNKKLDWLKSIRTKPNEIDKKIMSSVEIDFTGQCWGKLACN